MVYQQSEKHGPPTKGRNVCPLRLRYPGPGRGECKIQTNLLIGDGSVLERLRSPVGGLDDLTSEMLQLQHKREGDSVSRDGWSQQAVCVCVGISVAGVRETSVTRVRAPVTATTGY